MEPTKKAHSNLSLIRRNLHRLALVGLLSAGHVRFHPNKSKCFFFLCSLCPPFLSSEAIASTFRPGGTNSAQGTGGTDDSRSHTPSSPPSNLYPPWSSLWLTLFTPSSLQPFLWTHFCLKCSWPWNQLVPGLSGQPDEHLALAQPPGQPAPVVPMPILTHPELLALAPGYAPDNGCVPSWPCQMPVCLVPLPFTLTPPSLRIQTVTHWVPVAKSSHPPAFSHLIQGVTVHPVESDMCKCLCLHQTHTRVASAHLQPGQGYSTGCLAPPFPGPCTLFSFHPRSGLSPSV